MTKRKTKARVSQAGPLSNSTGLLGLSIRQDEDAELWALADELGVTVNPEAPSIQDYRRMALALAREHHARPQGKPGRPPDVWTPFRLGMLLAASEVEKRRGNLKDDFLFEELAKLAPWRRLMEGNKNPAAALRRARTEAENHADANVYRAAYKSAYTNLVESVGHEKAQLWLAQFFDRDDPAPSLEIDGRLKA